MISILTFAVAGVSFGVRQSRIARLVEGAPVFIVPEPNNKYDPMAIAVLNEDGEHLGYVGRNDPQREEIRKALSEGFVISRAMIVGGFKKRDGSIASLGLRVQWYVVDPMFGFDGKPEEDSFFVKEKRSGKRRTDRWYLERLHKADDIRDLHSTKVDCETDPVYRRQLSKQRRREFKKGFELKPNRQTWVYNYYTSDGELLSDFYASRA